MSRRYVSLFFFFFNDTATTEIYTLSYTTLFRSRSWSVRRGSLIRRTALHRSRRRWNDEAQLDRKSTRLNSSHSQISYAVFCLKKKKKEPHLGDPHSSFVD